MNRINQLIQKNGYAIFFVFCGVLYPLVMLGAVVLSFVESIWLGFLTVGILAYWMFYAFATTCCRCQFYGSSKCGLPGMVVPHLFKKKSITGLPLWRIKLNYCNDMGLMVYLNAVYVLLPLLLPVIVFSTWLVYQVVYKQKRFHGLMHILKADKKKRAVHKPKSIPVVIMNESMKRLS